MKHFVRCAWVFALAVLFPCPATAQAFKAEEIASIQRAVDDFLRHQTSGLPGKVSFSIGAIDPRVVLPACPALEAFMPTGARLWGATNVGVRCNASPAWTIYVTADIRVTGNYIVTARALAPGQALSEADLAVQSGDLTQLPSGVLTELQQAVGKMPTTGLAPGQPLRQDLLRAPLVVQQGQSVKLFSGGAGFRVSAEGRALNNAQEGQIAQARTVSGQTVSGIARAGGTIDIAY
jgi:flagella basal body P-ring formation protein FlgA